MIVIHSDVVIIEVHGLHEGVNNGALVLLVCNIPIPIFLQGVNNLLFAKGNIAGFRQGEGARQLRDVCFNLQQSVLGRGGDDPLFDRLHDVPLRLLVLPQFVLQHTDI